MLEDKRKMGLLGRLLKNLAQDLIDIRSDANAQKTIDEIRQNIPFRGYNFWILGCSAILASIGLDLSSGAVIIGAMLISPLMSPILGVGLGFGINDREMLVSAAFNLAVGTVVAFLAALAYFSVTPFGEPTPELLARTQPTILEVAVAFFGGVAGIVSSSRNRMTNAIPGVAIATALMPPLCTSAFGLATGEWDIWLGAIYLYFLNAIFISLSTYAIVKYLRFPQRQYVSEQKRKQVTRSVTAALILIVIPSVYFLYRVIEERSERSRIEAFIAEHISTDETEVVKHRIADEDSVKTLKVFYAGRRIPEDSLRAFRKIFKGIGLEKYRLELMQTNFDVAQLEKLKSEISSSALKNAIENFGLAARLDSLGSSKFLAGAPNARAAKKSEVSAAQLESELKALFPQIRRAALGQLYRPRPGAARDSLAEARAPEIDTLHALMLDWRGVNDNARRKNQQTIRKFAALRLGLDSLVIVNQ